MRKGKILLVLFLAFSLYSLVAPCVAHAYIDPGSGSFFVEMVIAALVGGGFALKLAWRKIIRLFDGKRDGKNKR